ncbi:MAG: hypothetical protein ACFB22_04285 [Rhodothalassiaceae bacterium]
MFMTTTTQAGRPSYLHERRAARRALRTRWRAQRARALLMS